MTWKKYDPTNPPKIGQRCRVQWSDGSGWHEYAAPSNSMLVRGEIASAYEYEVWDESVHTAITVPAMRAVCKCGIARVDCSYHKDEEPA